jgi:hypothetical protein
MSHQSLNVGMLGIHRLWAKLSAAIPFVPRQPISSESTPAQGDGLLASPADQHPCGKKWCCVVTDATSRPAAHAPRIVTAGHSSAWLLCRHVVAPKPATFAYSNQASRQLHLVHFACCVRRGCALLREGISRAVVVTMRWC